MHIVLSVSDIAKKVLSLKQKGATAQQMLAFIFICFKVHEYSIQLHYVTESLQVAGATSHFCKKHHELINNFSCARFLITKMQTFNIDTIKHLKKFEKSLPTIFF